MLYGAIVAYQQATGKRAGGIVMSPQWFDRVAAECHAAANHNAQAFIWGVPILVQEDAPDDMPYVISAKEMVKRVMNRE